jgi:hypothetical protein
VNAMTPFLERRSERRRAFATRTSQLPLVSKVLYRIDHVTSMPIVAIGAIGTIVAAVLAGAAVGFPGWWIAGFEISTSALTVLMVGSAKFETLLVEIERAVHLHTAYEELTLLEPLRWAVPDEQLVELRRQYEAVRIAAPSRPYPDGDPTVLTRRTSVRAGLLALLRRVRDAKSP